jgi:hypothetical protein
MPQTNLTTSIKVDATKLTEALQKLSDSLPIANRAELKRIYREGYEDGYLDGAADNE